MSLVFGTEVCAGDVNLGVISTYVVFKAMKRNEIAIGVSIQKRSKA